MRKHIFNYRSPNAEKFHQKLPTPDSNPEPQHNLFKSRQDSQAGFCLSVPGDINFKQLLGGQRGTIA